MPQFKRLGTTQYSHTNGKKNFSGAKTDEALLLRFREPSTEGKGQTKSAKEKKAGNKAETDLSN
jgi:hypothetical protein